MIGLEHPIVAAPMAGGASTPGLAAAVGEAGGLGFLAAGYKTPEAVREEIAAIRSLTARPFGVNVFAPPGDSDPGQVERYAARLAEEASRLGNALGRPKHDDDGWEAKLELVARERVPVVSFAFGCPPREVLAELREGGAETWVTVTTPAEARTAARAGADALVVQGVEAGGHRGSFDDAAPGDIGLLALLQLVRAQVDLPMIAAGGIATGAGMAAALVAGAAGVWIGTPLLSCPEGLNSPAARARVRAASGDETVLTRAFDVAEGFAWPERWPGRALVNDFSRVWHGREDELREDAAARQLVIDGRRNGDPDAAPVYAGESVGLVTSERPAGDIVRDLDAAAEKALRAVPRLLG